MAIEAREVIAYSEGQIGKNDKLREVKLGALHVVRTAVDFAEKIGALPASLPQFSRARELKLDQAVATKPQRAESLYFIPEGVGVKWPLDIGGKPVDQLEAEAKSVRTVSRYASDMMHNPKFTTLEEVTPVELIKLPVSALGLPGTPTTRQIFERAPQCKVGDMTLELCRAEVGPHQAIKDTEQPLNDYYYIMHEPITDRDGDPGVFGLGRNADGLWLHGGWARPGNGWDPDDQVVFTLRKVEPVKS